MGTLTVNIFIYCIDLLVFSVLNVCLTVNVNCTSAVWLPPISYLHVFNSISFNALKLIAL